MYMFCSLIKKSTPLEKEAIVYRGISPRTLDNLRNHSFIENIKERDVITRSMHSSTAPMFQRKQMVLWLVQPSTSLKQENLRHGEMLIEWLMV